jgi:hypothetical protein
MSIDHVILGLSHLFLSTNRTPADCWYAKEIENEIREIAISNRLFLRVSERSAQQEVSDSAAWPSSCSARRSHRPPHANRDRERAEDPSNSAWQGHAAPGRLVAMHVLLPVRRRNHRAGVCRLRAVSSPRRVPCRGTLKRANWAGWTWAFVREDLSSGRFANGGLPDGQVDVDGVGGPGGVRCGLGTGHGRG